LGVAATAWPAAYSDHLANLRPGVTELVLHVGRDDHELRAAYAGMEDWGAAWRQRDLDAALDPSWATVLDGTSVHRIGWRALAELLDPSEVR
jgi:hypothetical protein